MQREWERETGRERGGMKAVMGARRDEGGQGVAELEEAADGRGRAGSN